MTAYGALARFYDSLMPAQAYAAWAEVCHTLFQPLGIRTVLDLACGTGRLSWLLSEKGYEVIRPEEHAGGVAPLFICQSMEELDLYGTVHAAVCSMDSLNYLAPEELKEALRRVRLFMVPGRLFVFDIHTPEKLRSMDGENFIDESEDAFCVWSAEFSEEEGARDYVVDLFTREGRLWRRSTEEHREYAHDPETLCRLLESLGFSSVRVWGGLPLRERREEDERLFFVAKT